jgi:hypothetical protein
MTDHAWFVAFQEGRLNHLDVGESPRVRCVVDGPCEPGWAGPDCGVCVRFVDVAAPDGGDALTWATAANDVQNAVDSAYAEVLTNTEVDMCEVWVAQGTYYVYETDDTDTVQLREDVEVYGGFSGDGTETLREERDFEANVTTLDGHESASEASDVYHVVTGADDAVIDGFTITGGNADGSEPSNLGGGLYCSGNSMTVSNCVFDGNTAVGGGAGIEAIDNSNICVDNCILFGGTTDWGGGIAVYESVASITNSVFRDNSANVSGGGIVASTSSTATIVNCTVVGNSASHSAGIRAWSSDITVRNSIVWGNATDQIGADESTVAVDYSNVEGGYTGTGNIDADPLFVDAPGGDLHLSSGSPCIDAADGDLAPEFDIEGNERVDDPLTANTGVGTPDYVDIGAHEYQP